MNQLTRYRVIAPRETHRRSATCEEVNCPHYLEGWKTVVGTDTPQAHYIRTMSGREFTEMKELGLSTFIFPPGQTCFREHTLPSGRPPYFVRQGNGLQLVHRNAEDWRDDFGEHLETLKQQRDRLL